MSTDRPNRRSLFWICVLALFTAALSFSIRTGASGAIKAALLDPAVPLHSGEMIASALGNSFLGFALSLLVISPLLDVIGAKRTSDQAKRYGVKTDNVKLIDSAEELFTP